MNFNLEDFFDVVVEPDYSKGVLLELQEKYHYDSMFIYEMYKQGFANYKELDIKKNDYISWIHHFIIFTQNGGNVWDLKKPDEDFDSDLNDDERMDKRGGNPLLFFFPGFFMNY
jgi:hypothetical protein